MDGDDWPTRSYHDDNVLGFVFLGASYPRLVDTYPKVKAHVGVKKPQRRQGTANQVSQEPRVMTGFDLRQYQITAWQLFDSFLDWELLCCVVIGKRNRVQNWVDFVFIRGLMRMRWWHLDVIKNVVNNGLLCVSERLSSISMHRGQWASVNLQPRT